MKARMQRFSCFCQEPGSCLETAFQTGVISKMGEMGRWGDRRWRKAGEFERHHSCIFSIPRAHRRAAEGIVKDLPHMGAHHQNQEIPKISRFPDFQVRQPASQPLSSAFFSQLPSSDPRLLRCRRSIMAIVKTRSRHDFQFPGNFCLSLSRSQRHVTETYIWTFG
jgi:hypothetical protein